MLNSGRTILWFGNVNSENFSKSAEKLEQLYREDNHSPINLIITSTGGSSPTGFAFYDLVISSGIQLNTIGSGFVDSMGIIIFLAGQKRMITPHCTMLLHEGRRYFEEKALFTNGDMKAQGNESEFSDRWYNEIVCERTQGLISVEESAELRLRNTVLSPSQVLERGLAHDIWQATTPKSE